MFAIESASRHLKAHPVGATLAVLLLAVFSSALALVAIAAAAVVLVLPALLRKHAPLVALEQAVTEARADTLRVVQTVSLVVADEILLKREAEREAFQARSWDARATKAVLRGDDEEAARCIERKLHHEANRARLLAELEKQSATVSKLRPQVDAMRQQTRATAVEADTLALRKRRADARRTVVLTASGLSTQAGRQTFEQVAQGIARAEAEAEALETLLGDDVAEDEHARAYERTERAEAVEAELEALRLRHRKALPARSG